jgi:tRNA 2-thiouridine synthesizing protein A
MRTLDATGLKCPQPVLRLSLISSEMKPGEILEIWGDCPTFEKDVRAWCQRLGKTMLFVREGDGYLKQIQIKF